MSIKNNACDQVIIDMKTKITCYGPHNGIIVYCGVQQEPSMFWPYMINDASNSLTIQPFDAAPTFTTINRPTAVDENTDNRWDKSASCMSNQHYQLDGTSHDNFNAVKKVRLNVFETNPMAANIKSFNMVSTSDSNSKSNLNNEISQISNDGISSTGKPLTITQIVNYDDDVKKTAKINASNRNMRKEQSTSITRIDSNFIPVKGSLKKEITTNCKHYNDYRNNEVMKYDYDQIEKDFANDTHLRKIPYVTISPKIIDESINGRRINNRSRFLEDLIGLSSPYSSNQQRQQCENEIRSNYRNVPEQLYHLYETQDAFGNLLEQFEMGIEICKQILPQLSTLNISKKHLNTDCHEKSGNFIEDFGLSLIPENSTVRSKLKDEKHTEPIPEHLQNYSQPSANLFNDADVLRHICDSLYVHSALTKSFFSTSFMKVQKSVTDTKLDEIDISANGIKNILLEKIVSKDSEVPMMISSSTKNCQQLKMNKPCKQEKLMKKEEKLEITLEESKSTNMDTCSSTKSAGTIPIKSILQIKSRKNSLRKKVRFPTEWPQVIAVEHRLLIDDHCSIQKLQ